MGYLKVLQRCDLRCTGTDLVHTAKVEVGKIAVYQCSNAIAAGLLLIQLEQQRREPERYLALVPVPLRETKERVQEEKELPAQRLRAYTHSTQLSNLLGPPHAYPQPAISEAPVVLRCALLRVSSGRNSGLDLTCSHALPLAPRCGWMLCLIL